MSRVRQTLAVLAVACLTAVGTVTAAGPGSAAAARSTTYDGGTWTFSGPSVTGQLRTYVQLTDYEGGTYFDRATATPAAADELVAIEGNPCPDSSYYKAGLSLYGATPDWVQTTGAVRGSVRIACTRSDGVIHHFHWGNYVQEAGLTALKNCVTIVRSATTFTISADAACQAQDRVVNNSGKVLSAKSRPLPFDATLTIPGLK